MRKDVDKHFRFTKDESEELKRKAEIAGLSESALVRLLVKGYVPKPKPDKELYDALRMLSSISNNINQLTAKANTLNFIDVPSLNKLQKKTICLYDSIFEKYLKSDKDDVQWQ
jgi:hypothetical protein